MANYNNGSYVGAAIESVVAQTFDDWELLIVDDASTDDSVERIRPYLRDRRIRLVRRTQNAGYTATLIYALAQVQAEIVGLLDSDDALVPEALAKVHALHSAEPEIGLVLSQVTICNSRLEPLYTTTTLPEHIQEPLLWMRGPTAFRSFKRAAYLKTSGLDPRMVSGEDSDLLFKLEEVTGWRRIDEPLYLYRQLPASKSKASDSYRVTYACIAHGLYLAHLRRRRTAIPNLPGVVVEAWLLAAIRYSLERGIPLQALIFAARAVRVGSLRSIARALGVARAAGRGRRARARNGPGLEPGRYLPAREFQSNTGNIEPDRIRCIPLIHLPGHCLFGGGYQVVATGSYGATFEVTCHCGVLETDPVFTIDVYENLQRREVLAERQIGRANLSAGSGLFAIAFDAAEGDRLEFRLHWAGLCELSVHGVVFERLQPRFA